MGICQTTFQLDFTVYNFTHFTFFHCFRIMEIFDKQKQTCLAAVDLSRKGSIDEPIVELTKYINNHTDLFTLSSCSGRIVMLREAEISLENDNHTNEVRKAGCDWLLVSHTELDTDQCVNVLDNRDKTIRGCVVVKFEPFVLHVQCRDLVTARTVATASSQAGYRNSGMTMAKSGKIVVAVRSTHGLEVPVTDDLGHDLVTSHYVKFIIDKANGKMKENLRRIVKFETTLKEALEAEKKPFSKPKKNPSEIYRRKNKRLKDKIISEPRDDSEDNEDVLGDFALF